MDALVAHIRNERLITDYAYIAAVAIMAYDYALTLHLEIFLIWFSPWNYTKILFLFTRYLPVGECFLFIYCQVLPDVSPYACEYIWKGITWTVLFSMNIAEVVLCIRTWAIWRRNFWVGIGLSTLVCSGVIAQCRVMALFSESLVFADPPFPGYKGCFIIGAGRLMLWNYFVMFIIETVVLALMTISAIKAYRAHDHNRLLHVVHRDGIIFYVYILCASIANGAIIIFSPLDLLGLLSPMEAVIYSVLTTRIIFNIRQMMDNPLNSVELHTDCGYETSIEDDSLALSTILVMTHRSY